MQLYKTFYIIVATLIINLPLTGAQIQKQLPPSQIQLPQSDSRRPSAAAAVLALHPTSIQTANTATDMVCIDMKNTEPEPIIDLPSKVGGQNIIGHFFSPGGQLVVLQLTDKSYVIRRVSDIEHNLLSNIRQFKFSPNGQLLALQFYNACNCCNTIGYPCTILSVTNIEHDLLPRFGSCVGCCISCCHFNNQHLPDTNNKIRNTSCLIYCGCSFYHLICCPFIWAYKLFCVCNSKNLVRYDYDSIKFSPNSHLVIVRLQHLETSMCPECGHDHCNGRKWKPQEWVIRQVSDFGNDLLNLPINYDGGIEDIIFSQDGKFITIILKNTADEPEYVDECFVPTGCSYDKHESLHLPYYGRQYERQIRKVSNLQRVLTNLPAKINGQKIIAETLIPPDYSLIELQFSNDSRTRYQISDIPSLIEPLVQEKAMKTQQARATQIEALTKSKIEQQKKLTSDTPREIIPPRT